MHGQAHSLVPPLPLASSFFWWLLTFGLLEGTGLLPDWNSVPVPTSHNPPSQPQGPASSFSAVTGTSGTKQAKWTPISLFSSLDTSSHPACCPSPPRSSYSTSPPPLWCGPPPGPALPSHHQAQHSHPGFLVPSQGSTGNNSFPSLWHNCLLWGGQQLQGIRGGEWREQSPLHQPSPPYTARWGRW